MVITWCGEKGRRNTEKKVVNCYLITQPLNVIFRTKFQIGLVKTMMISIKINLSGE